MRKELTMIGGEIIRFQSDQILANKCISWNFDRQKSRNP